jgi:hypothetical protein
MFAASKTDRASAAGATDPYFPYVPLLLETTSTNGQQNNTFLDSSTNNFTITRNGTPTQGSVTPYWPNGYWSNYFVRASTQYLTVSNSGGQFSFGTGALTIECWVNPSSLPSTSGYPGSYWFFGGGPLNSNPGIDFYINNTQIGFNLVDFAAPTAIGNHGMVVGAWYHIAVVRGGTSNQTVSIYVNGTRVATATSITATADAATTGISISAAEPSGSTGGNFDGYISNYRVVKGTAVYDPTLSTLTVPTTPLTAITNTSLLTCQSNRFRDNSANNFTITATGTPKVQAFQPFSPTASYTAAAYGGSGYFGVANTDYLSPASSSALAFGNNAYTVEFWLYMAAYTGGDNRTLDLGQANGSFAVSVSNTGAVGLAKYGAVNVITSSNAFVLGQWNHVAISRTSTGTNGTAIYVNGTNVATGTDANNWTVVTSPRINGLATFSLGWVGYLSNLRIVNGTAVYTANFTPPTAPVTAITNTSLLLNYTNAGIYDAAVQNNAITVGDAQASTTQSKWSPTSMKFDGTGDWLTAIDSPQLQLGTGDFTIDGWLYLSANGVVYGIVSKGTATTGWSVNVTVLNKLQFSYTTSNLTGTTTLATGTWYYFAVVRSGTATGNLKVYLNGSVEATSGGAVTDNFNQTSILYVGADRVGAMPLSGYLQDVRITRFARTITTPTAAFPTR